MEEYFDMNGNALSLRALKQSKKRFDIDLGDATLVEVLNAYKDYRRKQNVNYRATDPIVHNIELLEQEQLDEGECIMPEDVTDMFYNIFVGYLLDKGLETSTINNYCGITATALKWGSKHNVRLSSSYDDYNVIPQNKPQIALTTSEVTRLGYFDIARTLKGKCRRDHIKNLEKARDMFVLSCNLGQRYSDMVAITPECFNRNIFKIKQQKTGSTAIVNIDEFAVDSTLTYEILERYKYHSPITIDRSGYGRLITEVFHMLGGTFDEEVKCDKKINGVMVRESVKKCELLNTHSGRRSFVSINVKRGKPEYLIRRCSGHKDGRSFQRYICIGDE